MDWNLKAPSWDLSDVDQTTLPNIETVDGSSRFGVYRTKGEFSVDLKLGHVGNSATEQVVTNNKPKDGAGAGAVGVSKIAGSPSGSSKRARALNNGNQTVSCLVDGCNSDLSTCRDYHRRHKVCELHSKTAQVTIAGQKQRFCQQCSRFHSLEEFDEGKRSCRKRLDGHNRRRRKPQPEPITRSGSFLSNYQGTQLLPFTSSHVFPSSGMVNPGWSGDVRLQQQQQHQQMHMVDKQDLFLGSSPTSYNNNKEGKQQLAFLQQGDSNTVLNNQSPHHHHHHHHLQAAANSSVCHHQNNTLMRNGTFTESGGLRCKMFCDTSSSLTSSVHDSSSCALSLLSSPPQTHNNHSNNNNNNNNNNGSLNHMVHPHHHHHPHSSLMQPLGLSLHDSSMEPVDTVLGPSGGGSDHCSSMYNMDSHHGSQGNDAPQLFPFQWE